jgi:hypothetical protein
MALQCFLNQTYTGTLELVVVDNSRESIETLLPPDDRIKYIRCKKMAVGALRNLGTQNAMGEVCVSWDEDDFSSANRIQAQVDRLVESGKAVTGWHNILYYNTENGQSFKYHYAPTRPDHEPYCCGTSQMYLKSWWELHPFPTTGVEDYAFQQEAQQAGQLDSCDAEQLCVARAHTDSMCPISGYIGHRQFPLVSNDALPQEFWDVIRPKQ